MTRSLGWLTFGAALTLTACGGDDGDGGAVVTPTPTPAPTSAPTPSPSPTPTPTPTPEPTYASFPLEAQTQAFEIAYAWTAYSIDRAPGGGVGRENAFTQGFSAENGALVLRANSGSAVVQSIAEGGARLRQGDHEREDEAFPFSVPPTAGQVELRLNGTRTEPSRLLLLNNFSKAGGVGDPAYQFRYASYAAWYRTKTNPACMCPADRISYLTFGFPTISSDVPSNGERSYRGILAGYYYDAVNVVGGDFRDAQLVGAVEASINYGSGDVRISLNLSQVKDGTTTPFGTYVGSGKLSGIDFSGTLSNQGSDVPSTFSGRLFGPRGGEIGVVFASNTLSDGPPSFDRKAIGVALAR